MKPSALLRIACYSILALALSRVAHAGPGDFIILGQGNAFWTNNLDARISKRLIKLQPDHTFESVGFTTHGDYVTVFGSGGHAASNSDLPVCQKISELRRDKKNNKIKCVAFTPSGEATLLWNQCDAWSSDGVPAAMIQKLQQVADEDGTLRSVAFGPDGAWVVLYDKTGIWYDNVPQALGQVLENALKKELTVRCVAFTTTGTWFCLTNDGWWTSDTTHPASKMIADLVRQKHDLHWIAIEPEGGPHDFQKFAEIVHQNWDEKRPGGYAYAVMHKGKVVLHETHGWARAPWEKHNPSVKWTLDKPMGVASVSKTVTAVGLLKLWEEKGQKFSLDGPFWPHIQAICPQASASAARLCDHSPVAAAQDRLQKTWRPRDTPRFGEVTHATIGSHGRHALCLPQQQFLRGAASARADRARGVHVVHQAARAGSHGHYPHGTALPGARADLRLRQGGKHAPRLSVRLGYDQQRRSGWLVRLDQRFVPLSAGAARA